MENNAQMKMIRLKIMLRYKCSVVKKCSDKYAQFLKNAQITMLSFKKMLR